MMNILEMISWIAIILGVLQCIIIAFDVSKHPQKMMPIMNIVWPLTGLYFPVIGMIAYVKLGRETGGGHQHMDHHINHEGHEHMNDRYMNHEGHGHMDDQHMNHDGHEHHMHHSNKPFWQSVFVSTTHCSSGCSLGDMIGVPIVFFTGFTIAGSMLFTEYIVEFIIAYILGIAFQYYGMGFQKHSNPAKAIKNAIKADTWSLIAFEIGMFGWMALTHLVFFTEAPMPNTATFWFMMQVAMMLGFLTSYPANWILVKKGVKHAM